MMDELGSLLGIFLREAGQVHRLLHDVEVFIQRKGHIRVTVPLEVPVGATDSFHFHDLSNRGGEQNAFMQRCA